MGLLLVSGGVALLVLGAASFSSSVGASVSRAPAKPFRLVASSVAPKSVIFGAGPVKVRYRFASARPRIAIRIVRTSSGRVVRRFVVRAAPERGHLQLWAGKTGRGRPAPEGLYRVLTGAPGGPFHRAGSVRLHGHEFPVRAPHGTRGPIGEFGAPRNGGRTHEGFDITANCGSRLVAVRSGRVLDAGYDPVLYGNYILIHGEGEERSYFYAHMIAPSLVRTDEHVRTGQRLGRVGQTGNAASTPCHLHFEIHHHGRPLNPAPALRHWDAYS